MLGLEIYTLQENKLGGNNERGEKKTTSEAKLGGKTDRRSHVPSLQLTGNLTS